MGSHLFDHPLWSIFLCFNNVICFRYLYWINISLWPWINHSHITHIQSHKSGIYFYFLFRKFSILCLKRDLIHRQKKTTVFEHCWSLHPLSHHGWIKKSNVCGTTKLEGHEQGFWMLGALCLGSVTSVNILKILWNQKKNVVESMSLVFQYSILK